MWGAGSTEVLSLKFRGDRRRLYELLRGYLAEVANGSVSSLWRILVGCGSLPDWAGASGYASAARANYRSQSASPLRGRVERRYSMI
jgi:hypothetical protein